MNKVLIIGASGSLGTQLMKDFCGDFEVIGTGTYHAHRKDNLIHLDITQEEEVSKVLKKENPNIVIIAAASKFVDVPIKVSLPADIETYDKGINNLLGLVFDIFVKVKTKGIIIATIGALFIILESGATKIMMKSN